MRVWCMHWTSQFMHHVFSASVQHPRLQMCGLHTLFAKSHEPSQGPQPLLWLSINYQMISMAVIRVSCEWWVINYMFYKTDGESYGNYIIINTTCNGIPCPPMLMHHYRKTPPVCVKVLSGFEMICWSPNQISESGSFSPKASQPAKRFAIFHLGCQYKMNLWIGGLFWCNLWYYMWTE